MERSTLLVFIISTGLFVWGAWGLKYASAYGDYDYSPEVIVFAVRNSWSDVSAWCAGEPKFQRHAVDRRLVQLAGAESRL